MGICFLLPVILACNSFIYQFTFFGVPKNVYFRLRESLVCVSVCCEWLFMSEMLLMSGWLKTWLVLWSSEVVSLSAVCARGCECLFVFVHVRMRVCLSGVLTVWVCVSSSGELMMSLFWYYRPEHTQGVRDPSMHCEVRTTLWLHRTTRDNSTLLNSGCISVV